MKQLANRCLQISCKKYIDLFAELCNHVSIATATMVYSCSGVANVCGYNFLIHRCIDMQQRLFYLL